MQLQGSEATASYTLALELIAKSKDKEGQEFSAVDGLKGGQVSGIVALLCVHVMQCR